MAHEPWWISDMSAARISLRAWSRRAAWQGTFHRWPAFARCISERARGRTAQSQSAAQLLAARIQTPLPLDRGHCEWGFHGSVQSQRRLGTWMEGATRRTPTFYVAEPTKYMPRLAAKVLYDPWSAECRPKIQGWPCPGKHGAYLPFFPGIGRAARAKVFLPKSGSCSWRWSCSRAYKFQRCGPRCLR